MSAVIGALRAELSASVAQFEADMGRAANAVGKFAGQAEKISRRINAAGRSMTMGLTAPIAAFGAFALRSAGDFESSMNRVEAATGAASKELELLKKQARAFGRDRRFTATAKDAADAMETLAKNGLGVTDILGGATEATLKLSAATGATFSDSADVATGAMQQFGKTAADLNSVVDGITGVLLVSKFGFDDYRLAMGQAGGVAGGLGLTLEDFNTVIAATSNLFASGSDAGTSFKTFLTRLAPQSKQAADTMKQLGLNFFDAQGRMKSMSDIAQMLKEKLGGLSDEAKSKALTNIFGTDAMRTAIGLMGQGADGLERIQAVIAKASAQKQMEARMKGLNGQIAQLKKQLEALFLAVADSGFLEFAAKLVAGVTTMLAKLAALPPPVLAVATAIAGVVAAIGPLLIAIGWAVGAVANLAPLLPLLGQALAGVATVLLGPWGLAIAAAVAAVLLFRDEIGQLIGFIVGKVQKTLGPVFQKIMADFGRIWSVLANGPIGQAVGAFIKLLGGLLLAVGKLIAGAAIGGLAAVLGALEKRLRGLATAIEFVSGFMKIMGAVGSALGRAMAQGFSAMVAGAAKALHAVRVIAQGIWAAVKQWVADGLASLLSWIEARFPGLPRALGEAARAAIAWVSRIYTGVKTWLVDKLGPIIDWAIARFTDVTNAFEAIRKLGATTPAPATKPARAAAPAAPAAPAPKPPAAPRSPGASPDISTFAGGAAGDAESSAKRIEAAKKRFAEAIRDMNDQVAKGLDERELPKSVAKAEELRRKIADLEQDARDAGVAVGAFAGQIGALRARINELETAGLQKEAEAFSREVAKDGVAVREFAQGGLAPLEARLQAVDDAYQSLRDRIQADIEANRELATRNAAAAEAMARLEGQLKDLDKAHQSATEAAKAQYAAEARLADLQAQASVATTQRQIEDLRQASGRSGPQTSDQQRIQAIERDLADQRAKAVLELAQLEADRAEAARVGDEAAKTRLDGQIKAQQELLDLVDATTATQVDAAQRLQDAYARFTDGLDEQLTDMIANWNFDTKGLRDIFKQLARDLLIKPAVSWATSSLETWLGSIFKGLPGAANGGSFKVNGMGVDRHVVSLRARMGENIHVTKPGQTLGDVAGSGGAVAVQGGDTYYLDARGAGPREVDALRQMMEQRDASFKGDVWDATNEGLMRGKVSPPSFA